MDARIMAYINELKHQRDLLAENLNTKGVEAAKTETFNTLVPKVLEISGNDNVTGNVDRIDLTTVENAQVVDMNPNINGDASKFYLGKVENVIFEEEENV